MPSAKFIQINYYIFRKNYCKKNKKRKIRIFKKNKARYWTLNIFVYPQGFWIFSKYTVTDEFKNITKAD